MTAGDWDEARRELDRWSGQGLTASFWMRDDDASETSAPLAQLHALAHRFEIAIGLAVIPGTMHQDLPDYLNGEARNFRPMCHGWKHINHGRSRLAEFGCDRPLLQLVADARAARDVFTEHFRTAPPIFVPPFNRISNALTRQLPRIGFVAISAVPSRLSRKLLSLQAKVGWVSQMQLNWPFATPRIDVHIDLIDWAARTAVECRVAARMLVQELQARRLAGVGASAPIGLLTHHLVHDEPIWRLCEELLELLRGHRAVQFIDLVDWAHQNAAKTLKTTA